MFSFFNGTGAGSTPAHWVCLAVLCDVYLGMSVTV